jgi:hypothetical protein
MMWLFTLSMMIDYLHLGTAYTHITHTKHRTRTHTHDGWISPSALFGSLDDDREFLPTVKGGAGHKHHKRKMFFLLLGTITRYW